jgi:Predicted membrane protein (DUF2232)
MNVAFNTRLLIGLGSGLVSGLILASASGSTLVGLLILFFLSPLPIAITGLGWGWISAFAASLAAAGVLATLVAGKTALVHLIAIGLPMTALTYLLLLHRERPTDQQTVPAIQSAREWYPIGRVLSAAALLAGALAALSLLSVATTNAGLETEIRRLLDKLLAAPLALTKTTNALTPQDVDKIAKLMTANFGAATSTTWLILAALNLWLSGHVCRMSGLLARPWPDLSTIVAPRELSLAFIVAVALSFLPDYPGLIASSFAAAIMLVYMIVGLAVLHNITRGNPYRAVILFGAYVVLVFLQPISAFLLAVVALAERFLPFRRKGPFDAELPPPPPT